MEPSPIVPHVALVIKLSSADPTGASGFFRRLGLPATWVIDEPGQIKTLGENQLADSELALTALADTPAKFHADLSSRLAAVQALSGQQVSAVLGDPVELRAKAAMLSELGITAVIADSQTVAAKPPKQLPCSLWQLDPTVKIPRPRSRWAFLPARRTSLKQVLSSSRTCDPILIEITTGELSRSERLLAEISQAAQAGRLVVSTVRQIAERLACQHEVKPQRSILRVAA